MPPPDLRDAAPEIATAAAPGLFCALGRFPDSLHGREVAQPGQQIQVLGPARLAAEVGRTILPPAALDRSLPVGGSWLTLPLFSGSVRDLAGIARAMIGYLEPQEVMNGRQRFFVLRRNPHAPAALDLLETIAHFRL